MKYLYSARKAGTKVAVVNPYFEPGLQKYWVPSRIESALFGTKIADSWFAVDIGGDLAFLNGVFKHLVSENWIAHDFISQHTAGFEQAKASVESQDWDSLERQSGATRQEMRRFAEMMRDARNGIFVWSMGLTQHAHGVETIEALVNVGLALGWVGREKAGLMPIRGHSGVQGGAEVGCAPDFNDKQRLRLEQTWGFELPKFHGLTAPEMLAAAGRGALDVFWIVGGNFLETLPNPPAASQALSNVGLRIHQDVCVSSMMLLPPKDTAVLFPATTRYESPGGGTETSTERRIIFSPEIPGRRIGSAKPEWEVFGEVAARVRPELAQRIRFTSSQQIRDEIAKSFPLYAGIETLAKEGDNFQWGGSSLYADGKFATPDSKAHFTPVAPKERRAPEGKFYVSTRRGKQFNSMLQRATDPLTGASRDDVLISREDAERLDIRNGEPIRLTSNAGSYAGRAKIDEIKPGNLEVHWPEGNTLLSHEEIDASSGEPDYNAIVSLTKPDHGFE
jgi:molybdopterin-dependent oxidoreductase alpha subunit